MRSTDRLRDSNAVSIRAGCGVLYTECRWFARRTVVSVFVGIFANLAFVVWPLFGFLRTRRVLQVINPIHSRPLNVLSKKGKRHLLACQYQNTVLCGTAGAYEPGQERAVRYVFLHEKSH